MIDIAVHTTALRTLRDARDLLARGQWTKDTNARDRHQNPVPPGAASAVAFCGMGAVLHITARGPVWGLSSAATAIEAERLALHTLNSVAREVSGVPHWGMQAFNDQRIRTLPEVLACYDTAIHNLDEELATATADQE